MVKRNVIVAALGTTQTLAWGSSYYLPAILAEPIAEGLGVSRALVFGVFSGSLLLSALLGPAVGRAIDNRGGRGVLVLSNVVLAAGLVLLAFAHGVVGLAMAWSVLGVGMALGLYDSAFATLTGLYGRAARGPITGITLIAGFASTIGWPLSAFLDAILGWRGTCLTWAALHLLIGLPLNRLLIPRAAPPERTAEPEVSTPASPRGTMAIGFGGRWSVRDLLPARKGGDVVTQRCTETVAIIGAGIAAWMSRARRVGLLRSNAQRRISNLRSTAPMSSSL